MIRRWLNNLVPQIRPFHRAVVSIASMTHRYHYHLQTTMKLFFIKKINKLFNIDTCMHLHELEMETFFVEVFNLVKLYDIRPRGEKDESADPTSEWNM